MDTGDIIIVGAGAIGLSCAWRLAKEGLKVILLERKTCGSDASSASMGVLNPPTPLSHNPLQIIHRKSLKLFPSFVTELENDSGVSVHYTRCGALEIIPSETQLERGLREVNFTKDNIDKIPNLPELQLLTKAETLELEPEVNALDFGALYTPSSAKVDVEDFILALKTACLNCGVKIHEDTNVSEVIIDSGTVQGVKTPRGDFFANKVLLTVGVWLKEIAAPLDKYVSITPVRGQGVLTKFPNLHHIIKWQKGYLVPYPHETVALGGTTEKKAVFDISCTVEGISSILERAKTVFPPIASAKIVRTWAGLRPAPSDRRPFIGELPHIKNLFIAAGHYKIGYSLTPITSDLVTRLILNRDNIAEEIAPFVPRLQELNN